MICNKIISRSRSVITNQGCQDTQRCHEEVLGVPTNIELCVFW